MLLFPQCLSLSCQSHPNRWGCTLPLLDSKRTSPPCIYIQLDIAYWTPMVFLCTKHFSEEINLLIDNQYLPLMHIEYLFRLRHAALPDWQTLQSAFKYSTRSWERYFLPQFIRRSIQLTRTMASYQKNEDLDPHVVLRTNEQFFQLTQCSQKRFILYTIFIFKIPKMFTQLSSYFEIFDEYNCLQLEIKSGTP